MSDASTTPWGNDVDRCGFYQSEIRRLISAKYRWHLCRGLVSSPEQFADVLTEEKIGCDEVLLEVLRRYERELSHESNRARKAASFRAYGLKVKGASWFEYMQSFPRTYERAFCDFYQFYWGFANVPVPHVGSYSVDSLAGLEPWVSYIEGGAIIWIGEPGNAFGSHGEMLNELHLVDSVRQGDSVLVLDGPSLKDASLVTYRSMDGGKGVLSPCVTHRWPGIKQMFIAQSGATLNTSCDGPIRVTSQGGQIHADRPGLLGKLSSRARRSASQVVSRSCANYSGLLRPWPTYWDGSAAHWEDKCRWRGLPLDDSARETVIGPGTTITIPGGGDDFVIAF